VEHPAHTMRVPVGMLVVVRKRFVVVVMFRRALAA
jgi:hypothetical protein